ncbi:hypothetical protein I350_06252 [Cryptococcus amylolentus CBS 6273]|uniref:Actin cytoskeleton-regulatory complex protein SLA1 n=1 Tax=Cryptococcus amylolentus CBS 6273 TaxID=1296118 RepID=A0A1E3JKU1_9TREE|nr:hypothetical protein I350_06252 [Cryptococcus amylolentus CBS 6273]
MAYVAVAKALYDYAPQDPESELAFSEDQILYIVDKEDDEWWKAKLKEEGGGGAEGGVGLVPANYVEEIPPLSATRAMFAYDSTSPEELSMTDEATLHVFSIEEDWLLVRLDSDGTAGKLGFVPRNYCEPLEESEGQVQVADAREAEEEMEAQRQRELQEKQRQLKLKDKVETWGISELDGKKKKKGTLGVGNAAVFFASDTDKAAPVKQYPITSLLAVSQPSSKLLSLSLDSLPQPLDFHCGSSDTAKAILAKLEQSKEAAGEALELLNAEAGQESEDEEEPVPTAPPVRNVQEPKAVRFASSPSPSPSPAPPSRAVASESATVLYDFDAAGDDELSVQENTTVEIVDKENEEWWLVKDSHGQQGVVPAAYLQLNDGSAPAAPVEDDSAAQAIAAQAQADAEVRRQADAQAQRDAAEAERERIQAAAQERQRQEEEDRELAAQIEEEQKERAARKALKRQEEERRKREEAAQAARENARSGGLQPPRITKRPSDNDVALAASRLPTRTASSAPAPRPPPEQSRPKPNPNKIRTWSDKTGQFNVEAEFLGVHAGKVRLHKLNGVIIDVPVEKMSARDSELIKRHEAKRAQAALAADDDRSLGQQSRRVRSHESTHRADESIPADVVRASKASASTRRSTFDWFEFFLSAGCDMDDCTRYATNFERDRIDETILPDLDNGTLRSLGLREGDVIRVAKVIQGRFAKKDPELQKQIDADAEYAKQLQEYDRNGSKGPAPQAPPGLFTGPNGKLANNTRRGRPEKKSTGPESVDAAALAAASDKLNKVSLTPTPPSAPTPPPVTVSPPVPAKKEEEKPKAAPSGFDDDAWTIKPLSSKPASPAPATITTSISPPPAPAAPPATSPSVANNTDSLLAQINNLRPASTGVSVSNQNTGGSFGQQTPVQQQQPQAPNAYGLGVQNASQPLNMLSQPTGASPQPTTLNSLATGGQGPRGPLAPVSANQNLLNPMQPQATGMFVPTRGLSPMQSQQTGWQQPQPTGMPQQPQQTGMMPQQTGMLPQQTGYGGYGGMGMQQNFTGMPQQQSSFNAIASIPPPQPPQQSGGGDKFAPSNIFAAMKKTDFTKPEEQRPQEAGKYDALRPLTTGYNGGMMPQQTGMYPQQTGMYGQQTGVPQQQMQQGMVQQQMGMPMSGMMPQMTGWNPNGGMYQNQGGYGYR